MSPTKDDGKWSRKKKTLHKLVLASFVASHCYCNQKNGNNSRALHFLKTTFKRPNMPSPYEKLNKACLWEWFTTSGELKPNYKHVVQVAIIWESMHALEDYQEVHDSLVAMLQKMKKIRHVLSPNIVQPIFHGMIKSTTFEILQLEGLGGFIITR